MCSCIVVERYMYILASLPALHHVPSRVLTTYSMLKWRGRRPSWSIFSHKCKCPGGEREVWGGGDNWRNMYIIHMFFILNKERLVFYFLWMFSTPALGHTLQGKASNSFFQLGTPPPLCLPMYQCSHQNIRTGQRVQVVSQDHAPHLLNDVCTKNSCCTVNKAKFNVQ